MIGILASLYPKFIYYFINKETEMTELQESFEAILAEHYPHLDSALRPKGEEFKYVSLATEGLWGAFKFGFNSTKAACPSANLSIAEACGRKQALEDVANGFIKQKSWTQDMAHAVVQHAAREGASK